METINKDDGRTISIFGLHFSRIDSNFSGGKRRILNRFSDYLRLSEDEKAEMLSEPFSLAQSLNRLDSEEARNQLIKTLCAMCTREGIGQDTELEFIDRVIAQLGGGHNIAPAEDWRNFESELAGVLPVNTEQPAILVAEDDESLGQMVQFKLEKEGFRVNWVTDGDSALAAIRKTQPDLVLLDVNMPGMSGFEVLEAAKSREELDHARIMMMTAQNTESDVRRALNLGIDGYIVKPLRPNELVSRINEVLRGGQ